MKNLTPDLDVYLEHYRTIVLHVWLLMMRTFRQYPKALQANNKTARPSFMMYGGMRTIHTLPQATLALSG